MERKKKAEKKIKICEERQTECERGNMSGKEVANKREESGAHGSLIYIRIYIYREREGFLVFPLSLQHFSIL